MYLALNARRSAAFFSFSAAILANSRAAISAACALNFRILSYVPGAPNFATTGVCTIGRSAAATSSFATEISTGASATTTGSDDPEKLEGNAKAIVKPIATTRTEPEIQRLFGAFSFIILCSTLPDVTPVTLRWVSD